MRLAAVGRLLRAPATLLFVFLVCFLLLHAMPGEPLDRLDSPSIPAEQAERNREALGLDHSLPVQFIRTLGSYARGDLGVSIGQRRPVSRVLAGALPHTALLGLAVLSFAYPLGLSLALALVGTPARRRRRFDTMLLAGAIVPRFWFGVMLIFLLHGLTGWFPASHAVSPGGGGWVDRLQHLVLPALALGLPAACVIARYQLAVMERTLDEPHVRAARASGAGGARLLLRHVFAPSLGPAAALFALDLPVLVSGAIVVEVIFAWPGVGRLTAEAVLGADYPLALASALLTATVVIAGRSLAELAMRRLDPRQAAAGEVEA